MSRICILEVYLNWECDFHAIYLICYLLFPDIIFSSNNFFLYNKKICSESIVLQVFANFLFSKFFKDQKVYLDNKKQMCKLLN